MKLVKESLNEIRQNKDTGLSALGIGKAGMLKRWADENFEEYTIKDGVVYPADPLEYPSIKLVKSGKIPDYVKVIAFKPFEMLELGDYIKCYNSSLDEEYCVTEKIPWNRPDVKDIIIKVDGEDAYENLYKRPIEHKTNLVYADKWNNDGTLTKYLFLYDLHEGSIGTFIYNGDKF
jgi:hypothetical protein